MRMHDLVGVCRWSSMENEDWKRQRRELRVLVGSVGCNRLCLLERKTC